MATTMARSLFCISVALPPGGEAARCGASEPGAPSRGAASRRGDHGGHLLDPHLGPGVPTAEARGQGDERDDDVHRVAELDGEGVADLVVGGELARLQRTAARAVLD